ncbi:hypothetical protein LL273_15780, partial [Marinobacter salarius]|uniref:hypothetical protein n=1 Tax=Marinobacter salarius TaxID=1420917 RepID=UPI001D18C3B3
GAGLVLAPTPRFGGGVFFFLPQNWFCRYVFILQQQKKTPTPQRGDSPQDQQNRPVQHKPETSPKPEMLQH